MCRGFFSQEGPWSGRWLDTFTGSVRHVGGGGTAYQGIPARGLHRWVCNPSTASEWLLRGWLFLGGLQKQNDVGILSPFIIHFLIVFIWEFAISQAYFLTHLSCNFPVTLQSISVSDRRHGPRWCSYTSQNVTSLHTPLHWSNLEGWACWSKGKSREERPTCLSSIASLELWLGGDFSLSRIVGRVYDPHCWSSTALRRGTSIGLRRYP